MTTTQRKPVSEQPIVLFFTPAQPCSICGRASHYAEINNGVDGLLVRCYEHGLIMFTVSGQQPSSYELQELYASITRFVIAVHDGFGTATVIGPIAAEQVPGYATSGATPADVKELPFEGHADAWIVRYEDVDENILKMVFAVWSYDANEFTLHESEQH